MRAQRPRCFGVFALRERFREMNIVINLFIGWKEVDVLRGMASIIRSVYFMNFKGGGVMGFGAAAK